MLDLKGMLQGAASPDPLQAIASMLDTMVKSVPMKDFERMMKANPKARLAPILEPGDVTTLEANEFLRLINLFKDMLPAALVPTIIKFSFGFAYRIDHDDVYRMKYNEMFDKILAERAAYRAKNTLAGYEDLTKPE